jgi:hypothetical protein
MFLCYKQVFFLVTILNLGYGLDSWSSSPGKGLGFLFHHQFTLILPLIPYAGSDSSLYLSDLAGYGNLPAHVMAFLDSFLGDKAARS